MIKFRGIFFYPKCKWPSLSADFKEDTGHNLKLRNMTQAEDQRTVAGCNFDRFVCFVCDLDSYFKTWSKTLEGRFICFGWFGLNFGIQVQWTYLTESSLLIHHIKSKQLVSKLLVNWLRTWVGELRMSSNHCCSNHHQNIYIIAVIPDKFHLDWSWASHQNNQM